MPFANGSLSFQRFAVVGKGPKGVEEELLEKAREHRLLEAEGPVEDETWGWCGGRHLLDGSFDYESNVFNDCLHLGLRIDTNKPPGDLKRAYRAMEEQAAQGDRQFLSKSDKRDAKDAADRRIEEEQREGRFKKSKMTPILWDVPAGVVYGPSSITLAEKLYELFDRTYGLSLIPLTSGNLALRRLESTGRRRDYEDARPTRFVVGPQGESHAAEYPWVSKGPQAKDFFGNEFLAWLWWTTETAGGGIDLGNAGVVTLMIDKSLDLDCCFGLTGRGTLRGDGPAGMPEARHALRVGKVPRKLGLILDASSPFQLTLAGESLAVGGLRLPDPEDADSPRVLFEERINALRDFAGTLDGLFDAFLTARAGGGWPATSRKIGEWIARNTAPAAPARNAA